MLSQDCCLKPIFHCNAKLLALGVCVGYTNMLVSKNAKICVTPNVNAKICVTPNASQRNIACVGSPGVGHVHFMLIVSISFALGGQRKHIFQWNMGLTLLF